MQTYIVNGCLYTGVIVVSCCTLVFLSWMCQATISCLLRTTIEIRRYSLYCAHRKKFRQWIDENGCNSEKSLFRMEKHQ